MSFKRILGLLLVVFGFLLALAGVLAIVSAVRFTILQPIVLAVAGGLVLVGVMVLRSAGAPASPASAVVALLLMGVSGLYYFGGRPATQTEQGRVTQANCQVEVDAPASQQASAEQAARHWCSDRIAKVELHYEPGEAMAMRLYLSPGGSRFWAHSQREMMAALEDGVRDIGKGNTRHYNFQYRDLTTGRRLGGCSRESGVGQRLECSVN